MIVYLAQDIPPFAMYCVYGESGSSLLIESTNSVISEDVEDSVSGYCSLSEEVTHALLDEVVENCEIVKYVRKLNTVDRDGKLAGVVIFSYMAGRDCQPGNAERVLLLMYFRKGIGRTLLTIGVFYLA